MRSLVLAFAALAACSPETGAPEEITNVGEPIEGAPEAEDEAEDVVAACVRRGVAYFREIGSYPTLQSAPNTGRAAEDVAAERCQRTTTAF